MNPELLQQLILTGRLVIKTVASTEGIEQYFERADGEDTYTMKGDTSGKRYTAEEALAWLEMYTKAKSPEIYTLCNGGTYRDCAGHLHTFAGLHRAYAYYAYASLLRDPNGFLTPTGFRQSTDQFSEFASEKDRESAQIKAREIADSYMRDCIAYIKNTPKLADLYIGRAKKRANTHHVIGE